MAKTPRSRSLSPSIRHAEVNRSYLRNGRCVECTLKRCEIKIAAPGDPAAVIAAAARLRPRYNPVHLMLLFGSDRRAALLAVSFGKDTRGVSIDVYVKLRQTDVKPMMAYLERFGATIAGCMGCAYVDEDGGTELFLSRVSVDELGQMPTASLVL